jgi:hypothetical protein
MAGFVARSMKAAHRASSSRQATGGSRLVGGIVRHQRSSASAAIAVREDVLAKVQSVVAAVLGADLPLDQPLMQVCQNSLELGSFLHEL